MRFNNCRIEAYLWLTVRLHGVMLLMMLLLLLMRMRMNSWYVKVLVTETRCVKRLKQTNHAHEMLILLHTNFVESKNLYLPSYWNITFADLRDFSSLVNVGERKGSTFSCCIHLCMWNKRSKKTTKMKVSGEGTFSKKRRGQCGSRIKESTSQRPLVDDK